MRDFRLALVQMSSTNDLSRNLAQMRHWLEHAVSQEAEVIVFPEMVYFTGAESEYPKIGAQYEECLDTFSQWAKEFSIWLLPGTLREPSEGKFFNTLPVLGPSGNLVSKYQKVFLFEADLPDRKYRESSYCRPGGSLVSVETEFGNWGLGICFDLRFPEFFRALKRRGSQIFFLPAAFTVSTGSAHWLPLLQARAIENQCFVAAAALTGKKGDGAQTYGHSVVISPWGEVLGSLKEEEGVIGCDIRSSEIEKAESRVGAWKCRRDDLFYLAETP